MERKVVVTGLGAITPIGKSRRILERNKRKQMWNSTNNRIWYRKI